MNLKILIYLFSLELRQRRDYVALSILRSLLLVLTDVRHHPSLVVQLEFHQLALEAAELVLVDNKQLAKRSYS